MSDDVNSEKQRLLDLLSDRALFGLSAEDEAELATLSAAHPNIDVQEMDRIVGLLEASSPSSEQSAMPASLKESILKSSATEVDSLNDTSVSASPKAGTEGRGGSQSNMKWLALFATVASLLVAFSLAYWPTGNEVLSLAEQKLSLVANASDLVQIDWTSTDAAKQYTGDVVWSNDEQLGFMTFNGLPTNDPTTEQYQLWIFDAKQDERYPIDGGVFDVSGDGAIVAIDAKIRVDKAMMFAITIEKPGGVVVSDRSRLPLIAKL